MTDLELAEEFPDTPDGDVQHGLFIVDTDWLN